jgi:hypothetical protein
MPSSMLLLNWIRSLHSPQAFASFTFLARKRCFSGGTDTSRRLLRPCGTHRALPDGDRRKKRGIDFAIPKHTGVMPRWSTVSENPASNWGARRHPASLTLKMRFKSLAAARNWVRENPETRPATSPRAPAAATPSFHPDLTPQVSSFLVGQALSPANLQPRATPSFILTSSTSGFLTHPAHSTRLKPKQVLRSRRFFRRIYD